MALPHQGYYCLGQGTQSGLCGPVPSCAWSPLTNIAGGALSGLRPAAQASPGRQGGSIPWGSRPGDDSLLNKGEMKEDSSFHPGNSSSSATNPSQTTQRNNDFPGTIVFQTPWGLHTHGVKLMCPNVPSPPPVWPGRWCRVGGGVLFFLSFEDSSSLLHGVRVR